MLTVPQFPAHVVDGLAAWLRDGAARPAVSSIIVGRRAIVDLVAVADALEGHRTETLTSAETLLGVAAGTEAGLSARDIADRFGTTRRTIVRHRARLAATSAEAPTVHRIEAA